MNYTVKKKVEGKEAPYFEVRYEESFFVFFLCTYHDFHPH